MRLFFFLLFVAVPLIELMLLIKVGEIIGILPTILLVIATAVIGVSLLKRQGLAALAKAQTSVNAGEFPVESVVDGACLLVAGAFLLTPGLLTDTVGFTLLIPAFRRNMARWIFSKVSSVANINVSAFGTGHPGPDHHNSNTRDHNHADNSPDVIEGEYEDLEEPEDTPPGSKKPRPGSSPWKQ